MRSHTLMGESPIAKWRSVATLRSGNLSRTDEQRAANFSCASDVPKPLVVPPLRSAG